MQIHSYKTSGGKDLIIDFLENLPKKESAIGYYIIGQLEQHGIEVFDLLNTRQIEGKIWEIKFYRKNRLLYILVGSESIYLLNAFKKQKGRAEKFEIEKAKKRAKEILS